MAWSDKGNATAYRILNVSIILTLAYGIFCIGVFLRAKAAVCSTTSSGVDLSVACSLPTIVVAKIRCHLMIRQKSKNLQTISPSTASPRLESACAAAVKILVFAWMLLAICLNLPVAARAPFCLDQPMPQWQDDLKEQNWRYGMSCRLHRGLVALSVLLAIFMTSLSIFDSVDRRKSERGTSLINCYCTYRKPPKNRDFASSISSSRSGSSVGKDDPLYLIPERYSSRLEHEQWQRRRNSLSSQKAIYPHRYQGYDQRPRYASYSVPPSRYSSTLRSVSEGHCLELSDWGSSSEASSQSSRTWTTASSTRPSTISSSRSRASSNPERGSLKRDISGEPTSTSTTPRVPELPPVPVVPPPAWSPALHHTPLSADPTIRALSTGSLSRPLLPHSRSSPQLHVQPLNLKKKSHAATEPAAPKSQPTDAPALASPPAASTQQQQPSTKPAKATSPLKPAPPIASAPPPPPPPAPIPSMPPPSAARPAPAIPARAPGHSATARSVAPARPSLRRPDPIRYRHYYHYSPYSRPASSHTDLPLQAYQHQRVWRAGHHGPQPQPQQGYGRNSSLYSASSCATDRTTAATASHANANGKAYCQSIPPPPTQARQLQPTRAVASGK